MIEQAMGSVCRLLNQNFGLPVYTEPVQQGMQIPCFFVTVDQCSEKKCIGSRRKLGFTIEIVYLPGETERRRQEGMQIGEKLTDLFQFLEIDGCPVHCFRTAYDFGLLTRGFNRGFEITDEVLKFRFDIRLYVVPTENTEERMDNFTIKIVGKEQYGTE